MAYKSSERTAVLLLEDGTLWKGTSFGKSGITLGEICFNTGMTGYQEIFTDPSYFGQILVTTHTHIGNYGISQQENESGSIKIAGLVCRNFNVNYSRKLASGNIENFFGENGKGGIADIDTRALVQHIRKNGAMNAIIAPYDTPLEELKEQLKQAPSMQGLSLSEYVTTAQPRFEGNVESVKRVALIDYGVKEHIIRSLVQRGCYVGVFPMQTPLNEILAWEPTGFQLSNGPGDPSSMQDSISKIKEIITSGIPVFGICLGHQLLSLAAGLTTYKMHNGHRGCNHPVIHLNTNRCEITSQNHGFAVATDSNSLTDEIEVTHLNLNDKTIEGIRLKNKKAFSVQYHPEANPGPHDSRYLFDSFIEMI